MNFKITIEGPKEITTDDLYKAIVKLLGEKDKQVKDYGPAIAGYSVLVGVNRESS